MIFYEATIDDGVLLVTSLVGAVLGVGAAGTLYGALLGGQRARRPDAPRVKLDVCCLVGVAWQSGKECACACACETDSKI